MQHVVLESGGDGSRAHFCVHQSSWEFLSEASAPAPWEASQGHKTPAKVVCGFWSLWKFVGAATWPRIQHLEPFPGQGCKQADFSASICKFPKETGAFLNASVLLLGFRWLKKPELCVRKAAGTGVVPKCLCLGICKAINVSFFLLQLLETPIFSIDFTQNAYCPWRCDLYLGLIYFCHGCSIF